MAIKSLRVLAELTFPSATVRLWDGSGGPFMDANGVVWRAAVLTEEALDQVEMAINAEAFTISFTISGIDATTSAAIWADYISGEIVGSRVRICIQPCDERDQPNGDAEVKFTGTVDNLIFDDAAADDGIRSTITIEVTNRFSMRTLTSGSVLSDADQKARAAVLNPSGNPDKFAERIPGLIDKTLKWPNF